MDAKHTSTLNGSYIRLEPLGEQHVTALAGLTASSPELYRWSLVPHGMAEARRYVQTALEWQQAGTCVPYATVRQSDGAVLGSTRFFHLEMWKWPAGHARHGLRTPDAGEIGYTWLAPEAIRTSANTEAKLLMLTQAFDVWRMPAVCLHTDERNTRSRAAMERMGAKLDGILRGHRMAADYTPRNSARYSIVAAEWPGIQARLMQMLQQRHG